jgi:hypothetical protein
MSRVLQLHVTSKQTSETERTTASERNKQEVIWGFGGRGEEGEGVNINIKVTCLISILHKAKKDFRFTVKLKSSNNQFLEIDLCYYSVMIKGGGFKINGEKTYHLLL